MNRWLQFGVVAVVIGLGGPVLVAAIDASPWGALGILSVSGSIVALFFCHAADRLGHPRPR